MNTVKKKIVAIGGGECGRIRESGGLEPYETAEIDKEIIRLTGKEKPRFLMLAHAMVTDGEEELTGGAASGRLEDLLALNGKIRKL